MLYLEVSCVLSDIIGRSVHSMTKRLVVVVIKWMSYSKQRSQ